MAIVCRAVLVIAAIITLGANAKPSSAAVIYPWCANYSGRGMGGAQNCGFVSFNQCLATVRGVGGTCGPAIPPVRAAHTAVTAASMMALH